LSAGLSDGTDETSQEFKELATATKTLMAELGEIEGLLVQAKKDNLCVRIGYERWKHTYECLDKIKQAPVFKEDLSSEALQDL
jgi:hypothetical protein